MKPITTLILFFMTIWLCSSTPLYVNVLYKVVLINELQLTQQALMVFYALIKM